MLVAKTQGSVNNKPHPGGGWGVRELFCSMPRALAGKICFLLDILLRMCLALIYYVGDEKLSPVSVCEKDFVLKLRGKLSLGVLTPAEISHHLPKAQNNCPHLPQIMMEAQEHPRGRSVLSHLAHFLCSQEQLSARLHYSTPSNILEYFVPLPLAMHAFFSMGIAPCGTQYSQTLALPSADTLLIHVHGMLNFTFHSY